MIETIWQLEGEISRCWWRIALQVAICLLLAGVTAWFNPWPGYYFWSLLLFLLACGGPAKYRNEVAFLRADYGMTLAERRQEKAEDEAAAKSRYSA